MTKMCDLLVIKMRFVKKPKKTEKRISKHRDGFVFLLSWTPPPPPPPHFSLY